jgi:formate dehydrogenase iron-sulfur subunit
MTVVRVSDDALALACGADEIAAEFERCGCTVERVSSWGMHWLEPLVEIDGQGFGRVAAGDVARILECTSDKAVGVISEHPFLASQQRLTFARAGKTRPLSQNDYAASGGWEGLRRAQALGSGQVIEEVIAAAGLDFPRASSGGRSPKLPARRSTSSATPTRGTAAPLPTAC